LGAIWPHADGFGVRLDLLPLNGVEIVIRSPRDVNKPADTAATA
jgi:hypothetical protein